MPDFSLRFCRSGETRQILLEAKFTPASGAEEQTLGVMKFHYTTEDGQSQGVGLPLKISVLADAAARDAANAKAAPSMRQVEEEALLLDASEAHVEAVDKLKAGDARGAKKILEENRRKLAPAAKENKAIAGKMEQLAVD